MKLIRSIDDLPADLRGGAITIGNFDGVHRGHAQIIQRLISIARDIGRSSIVFTFDPHPASLLRPDSAPTPLTWTDRKAELLGKLGVDVVVSYPTDRALLELEPREFFDSIIRQQLDTKAMIEGPNFFFGRNRAGDIGALTEMCREVGLTLEIVTPILDGDEYISSSRVRGLIERGEMQRANKMLTQPYRIRGMVVHGAKRGATIGFPTANLSAVDTLLPAQGVYAGRALVSDGAFAAAINIGPSPTFGEHLLKVEVHLLDYSGSLYGEPMEVDLIARLRDIQTFDNVDLLQQQLHRDAQAARDIAAL